MIESNLYIIVILWLPFTPGLCRFCVSVIYTSPVPLTILKIPKPVKRSWVLCHYIAFLFSLLQPPGNLALPLWLAWSGLFLYSGDPHVSLLGVLLLLWLVFFWSTLLSCLGAAHP